MDVVSRGALLVALLVQRSRGKLIAAETAKWSKVIKFAGIKANQFRPATRMCESAPRASPSGHRGTIGGPRSRQSALRRGLSRGVASFGSTYT
jgi:hypothetical protein